MEEADKTSKAERTIELNEATDGFLTQINHINDETTNSLNSNNESMLNNVSMNKGYILMDPSVLIPNEGKKSKGKNSTNYTRSYASLEASVVDSKRLPQQPEPTPVSPPPPAVIVPNLNANSFVNPEHSMSFVNSANIELKDFVNKKTTVNTTVTAAKLQSFSMNGTLKQPNLSKSNVDKSNFSRAFQFLPNILSDGNHFPNRRNFHHRRIFLRYLTTKLERENEFANEIKSNLVINHHIQNQSSTLISSSKKSTGKSRKNFLIDDSGAYYEDQQIFVDLKKASSPPSSQLERYANKLKQSSNLLQSNLRSKSLITNNNNSNNVSQERKSQLDDETKSLYTKPFTINAVKNVVDLNEISESSRLSGHYFSGVIQTKKKLADLNLNELWPSSRMYKVSIKGNSWVNSFKAKTYANEVNTNFRNTLESGYSSSRMDTKRNVTLLPNIKQIF